MTEPTRVAEIVATVHRETGYGPTREELAEITGAPSVRQIAGVRRAIRAGLIRYEDDRLVPTAT
jgi:hypothetical protein